VRYYLQREGFAVWLCHVVPLRSNSTSRVWRRRLEQRAEPKCRFDSDSRTDFNTCSIRREQHRAGTCSSSTYCCAAAGERLLLRVDRFRRCNLDGPSRYDVLGNRDKCRAFDSERPDVERRRTYDA
jgi:hypothetical protein